MHIENLVYFQKGQKGGNKMKNGKVLSLRLKTTIHYSLFTYSPIHLFFLSERIKNVRESDAEGR
jgi:hypothetical protein